MSSIHRLFVDVWRGFGCGRWLVLGVAAWILLTSPVVAEEAVPLVSSAPVGNVLVLNSYHPNYIWAEMTHRGIRSVFDPLGMGLKVRYEFMDAKHYRPAALFESLRDLYALKYGKVDFDVIVAADNDALEFLQRYRDELFPGVPVVFCGINGYSPEMLRPGFTGVAETYDLAGTIELALQVFPRTRHIAVTSDVSVSGLINYGLAQEVLSRYRDRLDVINLAWLNLSELERRLKTLPPDTVILYLSTLLLPDGTTLTVPESTSFVYQASGGRPIFSPWDYTLGHGVLGGRMLSGEEQGRAAAQMALQIVNGTPVSALPVRLKSPTPPVFDYAMVKTLDVPLSSLPPDAVLVNQPETFYRRYKGLVWGVALFVLYQTLTIFYLLHVVVRRKRAETRLRREEARLEALLELSRMEAAAEPDIIRFFLRKVMDLLPSRACRMVMLRDGRPDSLYLLSDAASGDAELLPWPYQLPVPWATAVEKRRLLAYREEELGTLALTDVPRYARGLALPLYAGDMCLGVVVVARQAPGYGIDDERQLSLLAQGVLHLLQRRHALEREAQLENQLRHAQKMEAIGTFAGGIAHDFNNILGAIHTCAELAFNEVPELSSAHEDLRQVLRAAGRGKNLVRRILDFSRRQDSTRQPVQLGPILQECYDLLKSFLPGNVTFRYANRARSAMVLADPNQIHQVIMNLCSNAEHAMRGREGVLEMSLDALTVEASSLPQAPLKPGRYACITVADTGCGIDPAILGRIFDPFFTTREGTGGTGLGLAMSHGIIQRHHGAITVESQPGVGTSFRVWLPCGHEDVEPAAPLLPVGEAVGRATVLLVDDDPDMLTSVERLLDRLGYTVMSFHGAGEALEALRQRETPPDLVVTDYTMPGLDGLQLAHALTQLWPGLPILLYTGQRDVPVLKMTQAELGAHGVSALLTKPFNNGELRAALDLLRREHQGSG